MIDLEQAITLRDRIVKGTSLTQVEIIAVLSRVIDLLKPKDTGMLVDSNNGSLTVDGRVLVVGMPHMLCRVIATLVACSPRFLSREKIIDSITDTFADAMDFNDRTIDSHIKRFRQMLPEDSPICVVTRYGEGYALQRATEALGTRAHKARATVLSSPLLVGDKKK